jgi:AP-4 complex subunit mu-1
MLSQFYILSTRGDIIISRNFRDQCLKNIPDIFFRNVKSEKSIETPIFQVDGIVFFFLKRNGLYFVCTTQQNVNPSYILETLQKIICVIKDFCGVLSEEALRRNFILAYEIIDEVIDCGYPQHTSTEKLKQNIRTEAILLEDLPHPEKLLNCSSFGKTLRAFETNTVAQIPYQKTIPSSASHRPVGLARRETPPLSLKNGASHVVASFMQLTKKTLSGNNALSLPTGNNANEIFVDVLEKINVVTNSLGTVLRSYIDGRIQVKSYLSGYPSLCVILNPDLQLKSDPLRKNHIKDYSTSDYFSSSFIAPPEIDDYNFHECVDFSEFQSSKYLYFSPPDGEFVLMNYR